MAKDGNTVTPIRSGSALAKRVWTPETDNEDNPLCKNPDFGIGHLRWILSGLLIKFP